MYHTAWLLFGEFLLVSAFNGNLKSKENHRGTEGIFLDLMLIVNKQQLFWSSDIRFKIVRTARWFTTSGWTLTDVGDGPGIKRTLGSKHCQWPKNIHITINILLHAPFPAGNFVLLNFLSHQFHPTLRKHYFLITPPPFPRGGGIFFRIRAYFCFRS